MKIFPALAPVALGAALALTSLGAARAQVRISSLPSAVTLTGAELIPAVQSGGDVTTTPAGLLAYITGHLTGAAVFGTPTAGHCVSWYSATQLQDAGGCGAFAAVSASESVSGSLSAGAYSYGTLGFSDTGLVASFEASPNSYVQEVIQNTSAGAAASADFIVANNSATAGTFYGDFGINSSGFTGTGSLALPSATYLYAQSGDLVLATNTANAIHFVVNNGATDALAISPTGVLSGSAIANYLASPPTIGGTAAAAITGTTITGSGLNDSGLTASVNVCADASKNLTSACTNEVAIANLAQIGANTVLGNGTGGTANVTALATTGSGSVVEATSPILVTPSLGVATATSLNALTLTANATGFQLAGGTTSKTAVFQNSLTFVGTDATTMTFPTTSATIARTDNVTQSFAGPVTFSNGVTVTGGITVNAIKIVLTTAATAPTITGVTVTVNKTAGSAAQKYTLGTCSGCGSTITMALPAATDGYVCDGVDINASTRLQETTDSATAPVLTNYTPAGVATNFATGDVLLVKCTGY